MGRTRVFVARTTGTLGRMIDPVDELERQEGLLSLFLQLEAVVRDPTASEEQVLHARRSLGATCLLLTLPPVPVVVDVSPKVVRAWKRGAEELARVVAARSEDRCAWEILALTEALLGLLATSLRVRERLEHLDRARDALSRAGHGAGRLTARVAEARGRLAALPGRRVHRDVDLSAVGCPIQLPALDPGAEPGPEPDLLLDALPVRIGRSIYAKGQVDPATQVRFCYLCQTGSLTDADACLSCAKPLGRPRLTLAGKLVSPSGPGAFLRSGAPWLGGLALIPAIWIGCWAITEHAPHLPWGLSMSAAWIGWGVACVLAYVLLLRWLFRSGSTDAHVELFARHALITDRYGLWTIRVDFEHVLGYDARDPALVRLTPRRRRWLEPDPAIPTRDEESRAAVLRLLDEAKLKRLDG